jgi:hypothetical protein
MAHPKEQAINRAVAWSVPMGMKVLLWKLMVSPVVAKKPSGTHFKLRTCSEKTLQIIWMSLAYRRIGQGRSSTMGVGEAPHEKLGGAFAAKHQQ